MAQLLNLRGIKKHFGATRALDGIDLSLGKGEVLALVGENGAGKSTLMKVLSGVHQPDHGSMHLAGADYRPSDPLDAQLAGVAMVHQELTLADQLSVAENVTLGREPQRAGWGAWCGGVIHTHQRDQVAQRAIDTMGVELKLSVPVYQLSPAERQLVEIARALAQEPQVLVLDEPTSSLGRRECQQLYGVVRRLSAQGVGIIFISHFLEECRDLADRVLVLRDGVSVAGGSMHEFDHDALVAAMVGRSVSELFPPRSVALDESFRDVLFEVRQVQPAGGEAVSFQVRPGEVYGLFGLVGAGRTELLRSVIGLDARNTGEVFVDGVALPHGPRAAWAAGVGLVSEDRKEEGLLLGRSLADNATLADLKTFRRHGLLSGDQQAAATAGQIAALQVKCREPSQVIGELSGGNQQKIAYGRLAVAQCRVLLLDEPTRGIDVGAKAVLYEQINTAVANGAAVVLVSSYLPELTGMCDRIGVMAGRRLVAEQATSAWTEADILAAALNNDMDNDAGNDVGVEAVPRANATQAE
jgi:ribose transport system ATP-binding protein